MGVPWCDLPEELLSAIANFLNPKNLLAILRFRAVCRKWRSSLPLPPQSLISPNLPVGYIPTSGATEFHLSACAVYLLHPPKGIRSPLPWLLFCDEWNPGELWVRFPFSFKVVKHVVVSGRRSFPRALRLLDFRAREIATYGISFRAKVGQDGSFTWWHQCRINNGGYNDKVVLFSDGRGAAILHYGVFQFMRFDEAMRESHYVHDRPGCLLDDLVDHNGQIYAVNRRGKLFRIDHDSLELIAVTDGIRAGSGRRRRLVESFGILHLVVRCTKTPEKDPKNVILKVYKLDESNGKWLEVTSLGDKIFFISPEFSFSVAAVDIQAGLQGNRILFGRDSFNSYRYNQSDLEPFLTSKQNDLCIGVFNLEEDGGSFGLMTSDTDYSRIFWPPPPWLHISQ